ncbi:recombinase zinc beta ribbon domain-containing protein [Vibrio alginolyticus]
MLIADTLQRVSSKKQTSEEKTGLQRQASNVTLWLSNHPSYKLRRSIVLKGESAYSGNHLKGDFGSYLDDLESGVLSPPHTLLIDDFTRLSRLPLSLAERLVNRLTDLGITIVTVSDNQSYSPNDSDSLESRIGLLFRLKNAHSDSERKSRMLRDARLRETARIKEGGLIRKKLPFWLSVSEDGNSYVVDQSKADIALTVHKLFQDNNSYTDILKYMKLHNIPTPSKRAKDWTVTTIVNILGSEALTGTIVFNHADKEPEKLHGHFPVILSRKSFDLTQAIQHQRKGTRTGGRSDLFRNVFKGLIRCGECGYSVSISVNTYGRVYLYCEGRKRRGTTIANCQNGRVRHDKLLDQVLHHLLSVPLFDSAASRLNTAELNMKLSSKQAELQKLQSRILLLDDDLIDDFQHMLRALKSEIGEITHQLDSVRIQESTGSTFFDNLEQLELDTVEGRRNLNKHLSRYLSKITYSTVTDEVVLTRNSDGKSKLFNLSDEEYYSESKGLYEASKEDDLSEFEFGD